MQGCVGVDVVEVIARCEERFEVAMGFAEVALRGGGSAAELARGDG